MKLSILLLALTAFAADKESAKLTDAEARAIRELQLTISQATIAQKEAQIQFEAAGRTSAAAREKLDVLIKAKEKAICVGGKLQEDLSCSAPPLKEQAKAKEGANAK